MALLHRLPRDSDDFDFEFENFDNHVESMAKITWTAIVGIIVGVIMVIVVVVFVICFCVCRRRQNYTGRTLYQPAPTATTTTTTTYPASTTTTYQPYGPAQGYPVQQQVQRGYTPTNYAPQYPPQLPPGQAPPPYPGPPMAAGYPAQGYPVTTTGQPWQQNKLESTGYPPAPPMDQSHLQKASAPPPEY